MAGSPSRLPMPPTSQLPMPSSSQIPKRDNTKRQSLLLPRGTISGIARKGVLSPTGEEPQRPVTMLNTDAQGLAALRRRLEQEEAKETAQSREEARAGAHAQLTGGSRIGSGLVAPKTGIARTMSMRAGPTTRASAKSQEPRAGSRPLSMVKEKSIRPDSSSSASSKSTMDPPAPRLKAPTPSTTPGLRRATTTTTRHTRAQSALPNPPVLPRAEVRRHPTVSSGSANPALRPSFSTLQQHYSPQKNSGPKPTSASLIYSQPAETTSSIGLDAQLLQTRLLQLSILHRQAEPTYQSWALSAKTSLASKFQDVSLDYSGLLAQERNYRQSTNAVALSKWCGGDFALLGENVAVLSGVVNEITQLVEDGGRVQQCIDIFEAWIAWVEAVYQGREQHGSSTCEFIEGLGDGWKGEVGALIRRMGSLGRQLDGLGNVEDGCSLFDVIAGFRVLAGGVVGELRAVEAVEGEVVRSERRWVDEQIGGMDVVI